jgi:hypothetical protein
LWLQLCICEQTVGQLLAYAFKTCSWHTYCQILNKLWNKILIKSFVLYISNYKKSSMFYLRQYKFLTW